MNLPPLTALFRDAGEHARRDLRSDTNRYEPHPAFPVEPGVIGVGVAALATELARLLARHGRILLDGMPGVAWEQLREALDPAMRAGGVAAAWLPTAEALLDATRLDALAAPYLGGDDPIFGTRFRGDLADFFDSEKLVALRAAAGRSGAIVYGPGAALASREGAVVYVDLPKSECQCRARHGRPCNLGARPGVDPKAQYKRSYFVDWPALRRHQRAILDRVAVFVDDQEAGAPAFADADVVRGAFDRMARSAFRARPWFEPGPWGGQWLRHRIPALPDAPNYAWSFELIVPENGLLLGDGAACLEVSFDWLMHRASRDVLGGFADAFGGEFPIRFDFLDTVGGGNLSLQCHPDRAYAEQHFGERLPQDETYYIVHSEPDARVYLGFRDDVDATAFRAALEHSARDGTPVDVERFVQCHEAQQHGLYLIPAGTVHASGAGNLVLEISATPYIFTFKMYDWLRPDLAGRPRPLNIARAFDCLHFERKGAAVATELICKPQLRDQGADWRLVHLSTHREHFFDVRRYEFGSVVECDTAGSPQVMMLVAGDAVVIECADGSEQRFHHAETFVVPAAAGQFRLRNESHRLAMVVQAFLKPGHPILDALIEDRRPR